MKLLDEELREGDPVICAQRLVPALPVQHQIFICVSICEAEEQNTGQDYYRNRVNGSSWLLCGKSVCVLGLNIEYSIRPI